MYTGHVTAGGSICLEALTTSGTPGSWQPDFTVESLMNVIVINMVRSAMQGDPVIMYLFDTTHVFDTCTPGQPCLSWNSL
jgi:ubiquitin-protein ligase